MRRRGLTTRALGSAVGVTSAAVTGWTSGAKPRPDATARLAAFFEVSVDDLLDDRRDLAADDTERRYTQAHAVAEQYPEDNPKARQLAFEKHLERSAHAKTLRDTAKRLRDEAERLDQIADVLHVSAMTNQPQRPPLKPGVLGKAEIEAIEAAERKAATAKTPH